MNESLFYMETYKMYQLRSFVTSASEIIDPKFNPYHKTNRKTTPNYIYNSDPTGEYIWC